MIIFVQYDPCSDAVEGCIMWLKLFINIADSYLFITLNIFPDLGNAQATFVISPFFPVQRFHMRIYEYLLYTGGIRIFFLFILVHACKDLCAVYHKNAYILIHLWRSKPYPAGSIHGLPHIFNKFAEMGIIGLDIFTNSPQHRGAVSYNR